MTDIEIKKTSEEPGSASLTVTVPEDSVREAEERATRSYQARARLPGFRKGKVPAPVIRKHFAADIRQAALEDVVRESWRKAVAQEALKPVAEPHVHNLKWEPGTPVTFEFHVEVRPDIALARTGGFQLKRALPKVTTDQVEVQLQQLREQRAAWIPVAGEKPAQKDLVNVTIATRKDGAAVDPQRYDLVLGEGRAIPDVEERILGLLPGETVDATVRFPDDFPDATKRGQTRDIQLTLHEVKRQALAALDDAFAREVGDFESLDGLRAAVRTDLEREAAREADARVRADLLEQIVAANRITAPRPLVERALLVFAQAYGIPEERFPEFSAELRPVAEAQVRRDLILDALVEQHGLKATEAELDGRIQELAARRNVPAGELYAQLEKAKRLRDLERGLTEEKVFQFLLAQSTVEEA
jgi:trigger factor